MDKHRPRKSVQESYMQRQRRLQREALNAPSPPLPAPAYRPDVSRQNKSMMALRSFEQHMTDEGWQLQEGLRLSGYRLFGKGYETGELDTKRILAASGSLAVMIVQDKREWDPALPGCFDKEAAFRNVSALRADPSVFRVTVCKDAHHNPAYHRAAADEMGCHAWITYYHERCVTRDAPYVRKEHLIRTYHSIDPAVVRSYSPLGRQKCILSGSLQAKAYPLRHRIAEHASSMPVYVHQHPGYHAKGSVTSEYIQLLSCFKVAICTASVYGYALRKLIEATAAGCVVLTDLPDFDQLPAIQGNMVRISKDNSMDEISSIIHRECSRYDPAKQEFFAKEALSFYDYRRRGRELAEAIDALRLRYNAEV